MIFDHCIESKDGEFGMEVKKPYCTFNYCYVAGYKTNETLARFCIVLSNISEEKEIISKLAQKYTSSFYYSVHTTNPYIVTSSFISVQASFACLSQILGP